MRTIILFTSIILWLLSGCSSMIYKTAYPTLSDGRYDSEFPYRSSSTELDQIGNSIRRINSVAFYRGYLFSEGSNVKPEEINDELLKENYIQKGFFDKSSVGTGTIILSQSGRVALLTCAHVVDFPDTVISYFIDENGISTDYVETILIKDSQRNFGVGFPDSGELQVLSSDKELDVAIVGTKINSTLQNQFPAFPYFNGKAKELEWGSFVYLFGFPMNIKMVSKAIVSNPQKDSDGSFYVDAVVNRGFSGGAVLAIRDGVPNFELVGIVNSAPEEIDYILKPLELANNKRYSSIIPYKGDIFVKKQEMIRYGIAKIIPIDLILQFINKNYYEMFGKGFDFSTFLKRQKES